MFTSCGRCVYGFTYLHEHCNCLDSDYSVSLLGVDNYACVNFLVLTAIQPHCFAGIGESIAIDRVLFVERSGELRWLARLSTLSVEPKGNQVLIGRLVSRSRPETG